MLWENSSDPLVNLCNAFRKAVVRELQSRPELEKKILGAFSAEELRQFDIWSKEAAERSYLLQQQLLSANVDARRITAELDHIVLEMSEKSAAYALAVLGQEKLRSFVNPEHLTQQVSQQYSKRNYPNLAKVFSPG